ncbi:MAG TPA: HAD hydrolase family protein [Methylomirabilota bacterium]|nr:HAD hydrolase family protein [Methylomirabilota bacterium]
MIVHVLACDYDGTIADDGRVTRETAAVLARVRESGRKLFLVTGRMLDDLKTVCPDVDKMFDLVVAENGGLLYVPERRETRRLGDAPEPALGEALQRRGVPFDIGNSILATTAAYSEAALAAIRETGVERSLVFNKGSLMLLPGGVTKGTGLAVALDTAHLSPRNLAGIGDAENDHAFLSMCECAAAVADAVPALRERADLVTAGPGHHGAIEFIERDVLRDLVDLAPRLTRHNLKVGEDTDGAPVGVAAHGTHLLVVGPSGSGKTTLTVALVEQLVEAGRTACLIDPEGDYQSLAEVQRVLVMGGKGERVLPTAEELTQLLGRPGESLVLDLSALSRTEKVTYATKVLATANAVRSTRGMPHWTVIDEAHHIFPVDGSQAMDLLPPAPESFSLITLGVEELPRAVIERVNTIASTDLEAFRAATEAVFGRRVHGLRLPAGAPLDRGEAAIAWREPERPAVRFRVSQRRVEHRRHIRKYTEGELPPDRSFYFRGPESALNLRAANLLRFCELAEGVDEATWAHHLRQGDYSAWIRDMIKDPELAEEIVGIERETLTPAESRRSLLEAVRRRYAV